MEGCSKECARVAGVSTRKLKIFRKLPVFVAENHNEVLPFIYRCIGSNHLSVAGLTFLHFDSHPDLLMPESLLADDVFEKDKLFSQLSIENWILPAVYAGHFNVIKWIKPFWATQIVEGESDFVIGKHRTTGFIRLTSTHPYFVSDLLYAPEDELDNAKPVKLIVKTLNSSEDVGSKRKDLENTTSPAPSDNKRSRVSGCLQRKEKPLLKDVQSFVSVLSTQEEDQDQKNTVEQEEEEEEDHPRKRDEVDEMFATSRCNPLRTLTPNVALELGSRPSKSFSPSQEEQKKKQQEQEQFTPLCIIQTTSEYVNQTLSGMCSSVNAPLPTTTPLTQKQMKTDGLQSASIHRHLPLSVPCVPSLSSSAQTTHYANETSALSQTQPPPPPMYSSSSSSSTCHTNTFGISGTSSSMNVQDNLMSDSLECQPSPATTTSINSTTSLIKGGNVDTLSFCTDHQTRNQSGADNDDRDDDHHHPEKGTDIMQPLLHSCRPVEPSPDGTSSSLFKLSNNPSELSSTCRSGSQCTLSPELATTTTMGTRRVTTTSSTSPLQSLSTSSTFSTPLIVLDVDLDFFSTKNPFRQLFTDPVMSSLHSMYSFTYNHNQLPVPSVQDLKEISEARKCQLDELKHIFQHVEQTGGSLVGLTGVTSLQMDNVQLLLKALEASGFKDLSQVDWEMLQVAGSTCDQGQLPHHESTRQEIDQLFQQFVAYLRDSNVKPVIVTVSRSTEDDYCPSEDVEYIQEKLLETLEELYGQLDIKLDYL